MATPAALLTLLRKLPTGTTAPQTVMIVGHNPGLEELSELLVGGGDDDAQELMAEKFPTGALAVFTFDVPQLGRHRPRRRQARPFHHPGAPDLTLRGALPTP